MIGLKSGVMSQMPAQLFDPAASSAVARAAAALPCGRSRCRGPRHESRVHPGRSKRLPTGWAVLITLPGLQQKKAYLEQLDRRTFEQVIRAYFNIVENNLYENNEVRH